MHFLLTALLCVGSLMAYAQTVTVRGQLVDAETGEPLIGASVLIEGTKQGSVTDVDGNIHTVVFVQADSKPENAIEIAPSTPQEGMPEQQNTMPTPEEGFWPVPVTIGISDTYNVEIKDGIEAGTPVFTNRETDQSAGW